MRWPRFIRHRFARRYLFLKHEQLFRMACEVFDQTMALGNQALLEIHNRVRYAHLMEQREASSARHKRLGRALKRVGDLHCKYNR